MKTRKKESEERVRFVLQWQEKMSRKLTPQQTDWRIYKLDYKLNLKATRTPIVIFFLLDSSIHFLFERTIVASGIHDSHSYPTSPLATPPTLHWLRVVACLTNINWFT